MFLYTLFIRPGIMPYPGAALGWSSVAALQLRNYGSVSSSSASLLRVSDVAFDDTRVIRSAG